MWNGQQFRERHNHGLQPAQAAHAARIANAVLRGGAPEGESIAIANKWAQHHRRDAGGGVDPTQTGVGGLAPSLATMNPLVRNIYQRYSSLPTEKLQEMNAMMGNSPQYGPIIRAALQRRMMQPQSDPQAQQMQQQIAASTQPVLPVQQQAKGGEVRRAIGGMNPMGISMSAASPWWARQEAYSADRSGFLHGATPGRADQIKTTAPGGAYIIPADVVSGLGEGNSLAGARVMDEILRSGPHGTDPVRMREGRGPPRPPTDPSMMRETETAAAGGALRSGGVASNANHVPVALSHGEYKVSPEDVARLGGGDAKLGKRVLDRFVVDRRQKDIKKLQSLPPPVGAKRKAA